MKVAILGNKDFDSLEFHLNDSLTFLGHNVFHVYIKDIIHVPYRYNYWGIKLIPKYDTFIFNIIANKIIEQNPDLVICSYRFIHPDCIKKIKASLPNVPVIHINPDAITTFEYQQTFASDYDFYFTQEPYIVDFMSKKIKLNVHNLPEAFNPRIHKPLDVDRNELERKIDIDVVAFGTMYPYRSNIMSEIIKQGVNVALFGVPDRRFPNKIITQNFKNEYITGQRKAEVLYGSKIVFNNFHYAEIESANVKYFEISGIGGFQICDYKPTLKEYSKIDVEKYTFKNINEAIDLIKYYLPRPEERYSLANEQMEYFNLHHTYEHRINQIMNVVFS